jgi:hypothetical protein
VIKPFQIVWELIEFGLQALFVYVLVIIIFIGVLFIIIHKEKNKEQVWNDAIEEAKIEYKEECTRIDGCRIRKDGTVEY